jgi:hypothetical protein
MYFIQLVALLLQLLLLCTPSHQQADKIAHQFAADAQICTIFKGCEFTNL